MTHVFCKFTACLLFWSLFLFPLQIAGAWDLTTCAKLPRPNLDLDRQEDMKAFLESKTICMADGERAIRPEILRHDSRVIEEAYPAVRQVYGVRGQENVVPRVMAFAWTDFRWESTTSKMDISEFVMLASSYGELTVESEPQGATIAVDEKKWEKETNTSDWTEAGKRRVVLTKDGCQEEEGYAEVQAGRNTTFKRQLTCEQGKGVELGKPTDQ